MKIRIRNKWIFRDSIIFLIIIMPIVDCVNGYFHDTVFSAIGPIYRLVMVLLAFYILTKWGGRKVSIFSFSVVGYFFLHDIFFIVFDSNNNRFSIITERTLKYIYVILLTEALQVLLKRKKINIVDIEKIFGYLSWLYPVLLIFPKLISASGTNMYTDSGYKGFFYSGNAVSITMVACLFLAMDFLYKKPCLQNAIRAILCLIVQLIIGAKTNYIFVIFILCYFAVKSINVTKLKNIKTLIVLSVLATVGIVSIKYWFADEIAKVLVRQRYLLSAYDNNWFQYLTSNRSIRIEEQFNQFVSNPLYIMFGMGYRQNLVNNFVEMDYFDLLFRYGMIITVILSVYYFYFLERAFYEKKDYFILYLIMQAFAMLAGHVFCDAMSGAILALIIAHLSCNKIEVL